MKNSQERTSVLKRLLELGISQSQLKTLAGEYDEFILKLILESDKTVKAMDDPWKYKSLAQWGAEEFSREKVFWATLVHGRPHTNLLIEAKKHYSYKIAYLALYIEDGLALYTKTSGGEFVESDEQNEDWKFLNHMIAEHGSGLLHFHTPPRWAQNLYINREDFEIFKCFFFEPDIEDTESLERTRQIKRNAIKASREGLFDEEGINAIPTVLSAKPGGEKRKITWGAFFWPAGWIGFTIFLIYVNSLVGLL